MGSDKVQDAVRYVPDFARRFQAIQIPPLPTHLKIEALRGSLRESVVYIDELKSLIRPWYAQAGDAVRNAAQKFYEALPSVPAVVASAKAAATYLGTAALAIAPGAIVASGIVYLQAKNPDAIPTEKPMP